MLTGLEAYRGRDDTLTCQYEHASWQFTCEGWQCLWPFKSNGGYRCFMVDLTNVVKNLAENVLLQIYCISNFNGLYKVSINVDRFTVWLLQYQHQYPSNSIVCLFINFLRFQRCHRTDKNVMGNVTWTKPLASR
jgi:hypothetical protein